MLNFKIPSLATPNIATSTKRAFKMSQTCETFGTFVQFLKLHVYRVVLSERNKFVIMKKSGAKRLKESKERKRGKVRERVRRFRERQREEIRSDGNLAVDSSTFPNRMARKRAVDKVKVALPVTPEKRVEVVSAVLESPTIRQVLVSKGVVSSSEQRKKAEMHDAMLKDAGSLLSEVKQSRSNDSRAAVQMGLSLICGETVTENKLQTSVAKSLGINRQRIAMSAIHRAQVLCDKSMGWSLVKRRRRSDAISEEHSKLAYDFWASSGISRPTGNKRDIARQRVGPNDYCEHEKHILEKMQNEIYDEFKQKYPDIKMRQRSFESCKPFFVVPARPADRNSCCCRVHVEIRMLLAACMKFRKTVVNDGQAVEYPVYDHLNDAVNVTLCAKVDGDSYYAKECCDRECDKCGVHLLRLLEEEESMDESGLKVKWERFDYVTMGEKRKLQLVVKSTSPGEMLNYFKSLLSKFPSHQRRTKWQNEQMKTLIETFLPVTSVACTIIQKIIHANIRIRSNPCILARHRPPFTLQYCIDIP